jgi:hypothetical protein
MRLSLLLVDKRFSFVTWRGGFLLALLLFFPSFTPAAEKLLTLQIGPSWPTITSSAWDAEVMYGLFIDKKVGFGIATDFLWNTRTQEQDNPDGSKTTLKDESSYMYPVMGFIVFDPLPYQVIHPMVNFKIGYNSLSYNLTMLNNDPKLPHTGYYFGLIIQAGLDGVYNLGEQAAAFFGIEYQWADTKTAENNGVFWRRDMSGAGIHVGFRFLL